MVAKFRGAGQGALALVAEIVVGELARALGLPVPEIALVLVDEHFGRSERDPEIQELLRRSHGLNVGLRYLEGAFNFDPAADPIDPELAARIVWLDALVANVDRTARNTNLMWWRDGVWLIDHGSALVFHHDWPAVTRARSLSPFARSGEHVLLHAARGFEAVDAPMAARLDRETLEAVLAAVPDELLMDAPAGITPPFVTAAANRAAYLDYFSARLEPPRAFAADLLAAQARLRAQLPQPKEYRR